MNDWRQDIIDQAKRSFRSGGEFRRPADVEQLIAEAQRLEQLVTVSLSELRRVYAMLGLQQLRVIDGGQQKLQAVP